jgi:CBS domain containing-hemolysin-like protein
MLILAAIMAFLTLLAISLQKIYHHVPAKELKRRARAGDEYARLLFSAVAYGSGLQLLLWTIVGICAAGFFVALTRSVSAWLAFFGSVSLLWFGFAWLPNSRLTSAGTIVAKIATPLVAWVMSQLHPLVSRVLKVINHYRPVTIHAGLFEKEDLLELIEEQKVAHHNRIDAEALEITKHALTFGDKLIRDVMVPRRAVKFVNATDPIGPILIDELHKSGLSRFPVVGNDPNSIVGTLYLHDLIDLKAGGKVKDVMAKQAFYVHEEKTLSSVLDAFLKTKHHLFMVVNNFEEVVGIIGIEDVIEQILGKPIVDEFDQYEDLRAVAANEAKETREEHDEAATEVVE